MQIGRPKTLQIRNLTVQIAKGVRGQEKCSVIMYLNKMVTEHINPLVVVIIRSGQIDETEFLQAFSEMFGWGWQWSIKEYDQNCYLMIFSHKAKLVKLSKFNDFNLLNTGVVTKVHA